VVLRKRAPQPDRDGARIEVTPEEWERIQGELDRMREEERESEF